MKKNIFFQRIKWLQLPSPAQTFKYISLKSLNYMINLFMVLLLATSCHEKETYNKSDSQLLRLNLPDDPVSFDPRSVRSLKDLTIVKQLFEGLMRLDQNGIAKPALAESVEISEDLLTYTFHLRKACWSNLEPITAYDFECAWKKALDKSFLCDYSYMLYPIKNAQAFHEGKCSSDAIGISSFNDRTLKVRLQSPTPYFLELVAFPTYYPVNQKSDAQLQNWTQNPKEYFICNGPFSLKKWSPGKELILEKNPYYWDKKAVHLNGITFSIISDNNTENQLFEKNELDWLGQPISQNIVTDVLDKLKKEGNLSSYTVAGTYWLKFNTNKEPFDNPKLRRAFSYSINRKEIITYILQGNQSIATGLLPPCMKKNETCTFVDQDIHEARKLLSEFLYEKGWESLPKIVLSYPSSERNTKIVQQLQQQWKLALGIEVDLAAKENQLYRRQCRQGLYQIGIGEWIADFNDPLAFLELFKFHNDSISGNGMNDTGWQNSIFASLLDQSLIESNPKKRALLLAKAEKILMEEMPIAPIYHYAFDFVKKSYVKDVILSPLGLIDFKTARIEKNSSNQ